MQNDEKPVLFTILVVINKNKKRLDFRYKS